MAFNFLNGFFVRLFIFVNNAFYYLLFYKKKTRKKSSKENKTIKHKNLIKLWTFIVLISMSY